MKASDGRHIVSFEEIFLSSTRTYCMAQGTLLNGMCQSCWDGGLGENGYMYMYGWVPSCSPVNTTTLLISYIPIQNKNFTAKK